MRDWIEALRTLRAKDERAVLVTVVSVKGSVPRGPGTRMVVTADALHGTIGGGHLEYKAIEIARNMMTASASAPAAMHRFPLGASLGQCCGGMALLLFEPTRGAMEWLDVLSDFQAKTIRCALVTPVEGDMSNGPLLATDSTSIGTLGLPALDERAVALARAALAEADATRVVALDEGRNDRWLIDIIRPCDFRIVLFGAGHVGTALVRVLADLDCRINWIDTRDAQFPSDVPHHVDCVSTDASEGEVAAAPAGAYFLVMTHSHALDEALAERILARDDFAYFGLIGSAAKRRQFEKRLEARGTPRARFAAMQCPIGIAGISGKEPEVIAIAVAAELLLVRSRIASAAIEPGTRSA